LASDARVRSTSRPTIQVTTVSGLRANAAMCCEAHHPAPHTATPSLSLRVGILKQVA
jgi:hypothetical protein